MPNSDRSGCEGKDSIQTIFQHRLHSFEFNLKTLMNVIPITVTVKPMPYATIQMGLIAAMFAMLVMNQMMLEVNAKMSMNVIPTTVDVMLMLHALMK